MVRARLQRGLIDGTMRMRSLYDDERIKMTVPQACYYCGGTDRLCVDHLIPKMRGGPDVILANTSPTTIPSTSRVVTPRGFLSRRISPVLSNPILPLIFTIPHPFAT